MGLEIDQGWNEDQFNSFLKLMLVSNNKAYRIDCEFNNKINFASLITSLTKAANELAKRNENNAGILLLRVFEKQPIILLIKSEISKKDGKVIKRFCLNLFSTLFSEDAKNNLQCHGNWEKSVSNINVSNNFLKQLISFDFLQGSTDNYKMTRLQCYSVPNNPNFVLTTFLHTLFKSADLEIKRNVDNDLDQEYKNRAYDIFIKNASVAKAQQGFSYQEHLVMLLAYLAKEDQSHQDFSLISEATMPEAWNDIVFQWNEEVIIFQQKHRSLYASSVEEVYSESEVLGAEKDASILKYYQAYCKLKEQINDPNHPLHRLKDALEKKKIKFIFFTNKSFPISKDLFLENNKEIKFKKINDHEIPLIALKGFENVIRKQEVRQIERLPAIQLSLLLQKQAELDVFLQQFYLFPKQKNAEELLQHCRETIKSPLGGFGQAVLANTFAHYVHQWFITENPKNHSFNKDTINNFFNNHERYHHNLVKYSCYNYPEKEMKMLFERHMDDLKKLDCLQIIEQTAKKESSINITILCQNPLLGVAIVQELFPAGERQIFTPFSTFSFPAQEIKYAIIVGEETERKEVIEKIRKTVTHIIQIKTGDVTQDSELSLNTKVEDLSFLNDEGPCFSVLENRNLCFCLTDLLLFATTPLVEGLSEKEFSTYVPQKLIEEKVVLPYEKLAIALEEWANKNKEQVDRSWFRKKNLDKSSILRCKIQIELPSHIREKSIQKPSKGNFILDDENKKFYYIYKEKKPLAPVLFDGKIDESSDIDFNGVQEHINSKKDSLFKDHKDIPDVFKKVEVALPSPYDGKLPKNWRISKNKKSVFYYPFGTATQCVVNWGDIFSHKTVSIIEAEAACGKTWHLRSKISPEQIVSENRIPLFIRIKNIKDIKNTEDPISELIDFSIPLDYLRRIAKKNPDCFHILLDGFDELLKEHLEKFKKILNLFIKREYSVTVTVRDYKIGELQNLTSNIIVQQKLDKFDNDRIQECLQKSLHPEIVAEKEISTLQEILKNQEPFNDWLGIPFHVTLISEWYKHNRKELSDNNTLSISEIFNFIIQHRIARNSKRNRSDVYKVLNEIAWFQIFEENDGANLFQIKKHNFKKELLFALERTGLLRDPFAKHPELFHRTFAEFLVAKKISRKLISDSCKNDDFNFKIITLLYRTECRVISHFFIGLFKAHRTDIDMPYELNEQDQYNFEQRWLEDAISQPLLTSTDSKNRKLIMLKSSITEPAIEENSTLSPSQPDDSDDPDQIIIQFNEECSKLEPLDSNKHSLYLINAFKNYAIMVDSEKQKTFYESIRQANIRLFLREDYPKTGCNSLFEKHKEINEFNIETIFKTFNDLQEISKAYKWTWSESHTKSSYAFKCWSQGGHKDQDFAFPILNCVGVHLNIIHAFYIRLYASYGGFKIENRNTVINAGLKNIEKIKEDTDLRAVFSSILTFLGVIDDWKSKQEHPELSIETLKKVISAFKRLLNAHEIEKNTEAKLFIHILFVDFIIYFNMRCYIIFNDGKKMSTVTLITQDGFVEETGISLSAEEQSIWRKIHVHLVQEKSTWQETCVSFNQNQSIPDSLRVDQFMRFFNVWEALSNPPQLDENGETEPHQVIHLEKTQALLAQAKQEVDGSISSEEEPSRSFIIRREAGEQSSPSSKKKKALQIT